MSPDPARLLRLSGPVAGYPLEPSNEELADAAGLPVEAIVRYDMNTLGDGPLPAVREAWRAWDPGAVVEYGDLGYRRLRAAIGADAGVAPERVIPGAGADELIRLVTTAVVGPGDAVVVPTPTFPMFAVEATLAGATVVAVPRSHPATPQSADEIRAAAERAAARLVWLCSPNNPTGDAMPLDEVARVADGLEAIVVVDQVYLEFAAAAGHDDLDALALRRRSTTCSSCGRWRRATGWRAPASATSSCRRRWPSASTRFACRCRSACRPRSWPLAVLADPAAAEERRAAIMRERARLADALRRLGCEVLDGVANFVTFRPPDARALADALLRRGPRPARLRRRDHGRLAARHGARSRRRTSGSSPR